MRKFIVIALLALPLVAAASQLDLAIIQFPEVKTAEELDAALANVNLAEITNSNRTMTKESYLKGGYVIFAQSIPASGQFASSTRISDNRAEVRGSLSGSTINVSVTLSEGVDAGLRRFSSRTYEASAPLAPGQPRVLSIRQVSGKSTITIKGQATVKETSFSSAIIGQVSK